MSKSLKIKRKQKSKSKKYHTQFKNLNDLNSQKNNIAITLIEMMNMIKLYHWKTKTFAVHKATDHLYHHLDKNIDKFIEVILGKCQCRLNLHDKKIILMDTDNPIIVKQKIEKYKIFLINLNSILDANKDSDLLSIRDDILSDLNQFLYLLSFH
jgi:hypothetical protein